MIPATASFMDILSAAESRNAKGIQSANKYRNRKIRIDGLTFASMKEARRYYELSWMQRSGDITGLKTQVPFELIPAQKDADGRTAERAVRYIADFVYTTKDGARVVEDAKGVKTQEYIIKRKLMLWVYGIRIREV